MSSIRTPRSVAAVRSLLITVCGAALVTASPGCGGDAGRDASAVEPGGTPAFSPEVAVRACVFAGACLSSPVFSTAAGECVHQLERARLVPSSAGLVRLAKCAEKATSCNEVLGCASGSHGPDYCLANPGSSCDGDVVVYCPAKATATWAVDPPPQDCAADGMMCIDGGCTNGKSCTHWPIVYNCYGNELTGCGLVEPMWESVIDCGTVYPGGRCGVLNGSLGCLPRESEVCPFNTQTPYSCSGNVLNGCDSVAKATLDCDSLDSDCHDDHLGSVTCEPRARECTHSSPDSCSGAALSVCVDGRYREFDCATLGLGPCRVADDGRAVCGPPLP